LPRAFCSGRWATPMTNKSEPQAVAASEPHDADLRVDLEKAHEAHERYGPVAVELGRLNSELEHLNFREGQRERERKADDAGNRKMQGEKGHAVDQARGPPFVVGVRVPAAEEQKRLREPPKFIGIPDNEPRGRNQSAVWKALKYLFPDGVPEELATAGLLIQVNGYINKQKRSDIEVKKVTRYDVARVLGRRE
jgi:hypothetical protein